MVVRSELASYLLRANPWKGGTSRKYDIHLSVAQCSPMAITEITLKLLEVNRFTTAWERVIDHRAVVLHL